MSPSGDSVSGLGKTHQVGGSIPPNDRKRRGGGRKGQARRKKRRSDENQVFRFDHAVPDESETVDTTAPEKTEDTRDADGDGEGGHVNILA